MNTKIKDNRPNKEWIDTFLPSKKTDPLYLPGIIEIGRVWRMGRCLWL